MTADGQGGSTVSERFCGRCGAPIRTASSFCGTCGAPVPAAAAPAFTPAAPRKGRALVWLGVLALLAAGGIVAAIVAGGGEAAAVSLTDEATGAAVPLDSEFGGSLSRERAVARYRIANVRAGQQLMASATTPRSGVEPFLRLDTDDGKQLAADYLDGSLTYRFGEAGTYHLEVGGALGDFRLRVSVSAAGGDDPTCPSPVPGGQATRVTGTGIVGEWEEIGGGPQRFTFRPDGTHSQQFGTSPAREGSYRYDEVAGRMTLTIPGLSEQCDRLEVSVTIVGDELTMTPRSACELQIDNPETKSFKRVG